MEIRRLDDGEWCVDLGRKWYRVRADGTVTTKMTTRRKGSLFGSVKSRPATDAEARFAKGAVDTHRAI
jgi:hypothetical protein